MSLKEKLQEDLKSSMKNKDTVRKSVVTLIRASIKQYEVDNRVELDDEGIRTINAKIDYLTGKKGYTKVLNENTPQVVVYEILNYVFNEQHKKNIKRLRCPLPIN